MIRRRAFGLLGMALITLAGASTPAAAKSTDGSWLVPWTGNQLYDWCNSTTTDMDHGMCFGLITGVVTGASTEAKECIWNIPGQVTAKQLVDIVKKSLADHPESRQNPADVLIAVAIERAFPCKTP